jgi:hypothetical protein
MEIGAVVVVVLCLFTVMILISEPSANSNKYRGKYLKRKNKKGNALVTPDENN